MTQTFARVVFSLTFLLLLASCQESNVNRESAPQVPPPTSLGNVPQPKTTEQAPDDPAVGTEAYSLSKLDEDQKSVVDALAALGGKRLTEISPDEARKQPTTAEAVRAVLKKNGKDPTPEAVAKVEDRQIPGPASQLPIRVYTPEAGKAPYPVILYFHGGGFVLASNDASDASARAIANAAEAVVVAVDYRLAPQAKFPAAHDDASAAYAWLTKNASSVQGDASRLAVMGESAGGSLALNVAIAARDKRWPAPVAVALIYPLASNDLNAKSYSEHANAKPLSSAMIPWFTGQYFRTPADAQDPRINLVAAQLGGLPPTTIVNAEVDPLRSEGELLAKKLEAAGVDVKQKTYEGVAHEFFGQGAVVGDAKDAVEWVADRLEDAFEKD